MVYEERLVVRASKWDVPGGGQLMTCSAEDLVVMKCFADRPQDWIDVEGIVQRQNEKLNSKLVIEELTLLAELKESPELVDRFRKMISSLS